MTEVVRWLDVAALWVICWVAFATLVRRPEVRDWVSLVVALALIGLLGGSFFGAVAVAVHAYHPAGWGSLLIVSGSVIAARYYLSAFDLRRQLRLLRAWTRCLVRRGRGWFQ